MKTTVFTKHHIANGAKMAEFAGYNMPIEFTGINEEHLAVRNNAGVFDVSHMGEVWVKGPKAEAFLQHITTNDVAALYDGKVQYTTMPNGKGGIVDDLLVYRIDAETYLLVINAANIDKDWNHIVEEGKKFGLEAGHGKQLYNASDEICQLAIQGPNAMKIVQKLCTEPVEDMEYYTFKKLKVAGVDAILSITGYTGAPIEAGLNWLTKFVDGKEFIDRKLMEEQKAGGLTRKLVGFKMIDRGIPRHGYQIASPEGDIIGQVTSGTMSPCLKQGIGMGYVKKEFAKVGTQIAIVIREKLMKAEVVKLPFIQQK